MRCIQASHRRSYFDLWLWNCNERDRSQWVAHVRRDQVAHFKAKIIRLAYLEISVDDIISMEMFNSQKDLDKVKLSHRFLKPSFFRKMEEELSARAEVKHEMDVVFWLEGLFVAPHQEWMVAYNLEDFLFCFDLFELGGHCSTVHSMSELETSRFSQRLHSVEPSVDFIAH